MCVCICVYSRIIATHTTALLHSTSVNIECNGALCFGFLLPHYGRLFVCVSSIWCAAQNLPSTAYRFTPSPAQCAQTMQNCSVSRRLLAFQQYSHVVMSILWMCAGFVGRTARPIIRIAGRLGGCCLAKLLLASIHPDLAFNYNRFTTVADESNTTIGDNIAREMCTPRSISIKKKV